MSKRAEHEHKPSVGQLRSVTDKPLCQPSVSAIVMASGQGQRMQKSSAGLEIPYGSKLHLPLQGKPLYSHVFALLEKALRKGIIQELIVVSADETLLSEASRLGAQTVRNPHPEQGQSASISLGAQAACKGNHLMYFVADQPLMRLETLERLIKGAQQDTEAIVLPCCEGRRANPVVFPPQAMSFLLKLTGDKGGRAIFEHFRLKYVEVLDLWECFDIDTQDDYYQIQKHVEAMNAQSQDYKDTPALKGPVCLIRGAGDVASGVIQAFVRAGFRVLALELERPLTIRRTVAASEAVYTGSTQVEDIKVKRCEKLDEVLKCWEQGILPLVIDPQAHWRHILAQASAELTPTLIIDASLAKKDIGTRKEMAPVSIALGPGYCAGLGDEAQVDAVIETQRGHDLGRVIRTGAALPNTGIPGNIAGYGRERVVHAPASGIFKACAQIGDLVHKGQAIAHIKTDTGLVEVQAQLDGLLRGLLRSDLIVKEGLKVADVDPRGTEVDYLSISDKARNLGGSCLQAALLIMREKGLLPGF